MSAWPSASQYLRGRERVSPAIPFSGSVPTGKATGATLDLSLQEAFERALKYNLGKIESSEDTRAAHAMRLRSLNALLPNLSARLSGYSSTARSALRRPELIEGPRSALSGGGRALRRRGCPRLPLPGDLSAGPTSRTGSRRPRARRRRNIPTRVIGIWWCSPLATPISWSFRTWRRWTRSAPR